MSLEIDYLKFCLESMRDPDYEPLVRNKREIEMLQEKITLKYTQLITERERKEKIINEIRKGTLNINELIKT